MGIFDKAKDFASGNADKVDGFVDKAGDMVDERTGGQYAEHVDKGQDFVRGQYGGGQAETPAEPGISDPAAMAPGEPGADVPAPEFPAEEGGLPEENPPM